MSNDPVTFPSAGHDHLACVNSALGVAAAVDNGWLAKRLAMGARTAVSRVMGQAQERLRKDRKTKSLVRRLEKKIGEA